MLNMANLDCVVDASGYIDAMKEMGYFTGGHSATNSNFLFVPRGAPMFHMASKFHSTTVGDVITVDKTKMEELSQDDRATENLLKVFCNVHGAGDHLQELLDAGHVRFMGIATDTTITTDTNTAISVNVTGFADVLMDPKYFEDVPIKTAFEISGRLGPKFGNVPNDFRTAAVVPARDKRRGVVTEFKPDYDSDKKSPTYKAYMENDVMLGALIKRPQGNQECHAGFTLSRNSPFTSNKPREIVKNETRSNN
jgi:hypothetical protein